MTDNSNNAATKSREQVAEENKKETDEAHRLAAEQQERDRLAGVKPVLSSVADSIKEKLKNDDFKVAVDDNGQPVPARPAKNE